MENDISSKWQAGVVVLILDETDLKIKKVKKDTEDHFIKREGIMHQEDLTLINLSLIHI